MENKLREDVEDYTDKSDRRDRANAKREKEEAIELGMLNVASLYAAGKGEEAVNLLEELQRANPLIATKLASNAAVLDGDTNEKYAQIIFNIDIRKFEILIHPKSYIHSIIKFFNGKIKILAHDTDMKIPIFN